MTNVISCHLIMKKYMKMLFFYFFYLCFFFGQMDFDMKMYAENTHSSYILFKILRMIFAWRSDHRLARAHFQLKRILDISIKFLFVYSTWKVRSCCYFLKLRCWFNTLKRFIRIYVLLLCKDWRRRWWCRI